MIEKTLPVVEIFGPTIQGEGMEQGVPVHFVRFGGCDYRCGWCDTPYAVIPAEVRENITKMTSNAIRLSLMVNVRKSAPWVVLSGGNPALLDLRPLINELHQYGFKVAVETQGSWYQDWFCMLDRLCISPKPPSAGITAEQQDHARRIIQEVMNVGLNSITFLKIPIFTKEDLDFAEFTHLTFHNVPMYLTAGNDAGRTVGDPTREDKRDIGEVQTDLCAGYAELVEAVLRRETLRNSRVVVQAQMHVLAWGNQRGV
jgi:7-carboxy-7-deazaguanine synthase